MRNAAPQESLGAADPTERREQVRPQDVPVVGPPVGQLPLGERPDALVRIQLGGVGRERLEVQSGDSGAERADDGTLVDRPVVPHDDHAAAKVAEKLPEERTHGRGLEVVVVQL